MQSWPAFVAIQSINSSSAFQLSCKVKLWGKIQWYKRDNTGCASWWLACGMNLGSTVICFSSRSDYTAKFEGKKCPLRISNFLALSFPCSLAPSPPWAQLRFCVAVASVQHGHILWWWDTTVSTARAGPTSRQNIITAFILFFQGICGSKLKFILRFLLIMKSFNVFIMKQSLFFMAWSEHKMTASPEAEGCVHFSEGNLILLLLYFYHNSWILVCLKRVICLKHW